MHKYNNSLTFRWFSHKNLVIGVSEKLRKFYLKIARRICDALKLYNIFYTQMVSLKHSRYSEKILHLFLSHFDNAAAQYQLYASYQNIYLILNTYTQTKSH